MFDWTAANELNSLTDGVSNTTFTYGWDAASQIDSVTTSTGLVRDYVFDSLGRLDTDTLTDSGSGVLASFDYGYDAEFMRSKQVDLPGNAQSGLHEYAYDLAGRLASWSSPVEGVVGYSWDGAGNRLTAGADSYSYDERNRMVTGPEGAYVYSKRGSLASLVTGAGVVTYDFDSLGRLTDYNGEVSYTYDGLDRVAARNGTSFTYEGSSWDPISDGTFSYGRSPSGRLVSQTDGVTPMLVGLDAHGDLSFLYSAAGVVSDTALFDPFGDPVASTGSTAPTLGFQADFTDPVSEHVWMGSRWYDGGWAVFLSRDTVFGELRTPISLNRYTYAYANPISYFDPDGRRPLPSVDGVCDPSACGSITQSDPKTALHTTTVLSEGCNAAGYCEYGGSASSSPEPASASKDQALHVVADREGDQTEAQVWAPAAVDGGEVLVKDLASIIAKELGKTQAWAEALADQAAWLDRSKFPSEAAYNEALIAEVERLSLRIDGAERAVTKLELHNLRVGVLAKYLGPVGDAVEVGLGVREVVKAYEVKGRDASLATAGLVSTQFVMGYLGGAAGLGVCTAFAAGIVILAACAAGGGTAASAYATTPVYDHFYRLGYGQPDAPVGCSRVAGFDICPLPES